MAIAEAVASDLVHCDVLLRAEPGAGKSTGLPLVLLANAHIRGQIVMLEPRRLAARLVATRLAEHLGEPIGQRIGLRMRADTRVSPDTRLTVVTEGVLTRWLQDDPGLDGVSLVIFDEFHERSLQADVGLALCLDVQQALRPDLRLLMMSATLDASPLRALFFNAADHECRVRQHPIDIHWDPRDSASTLESHVSAAVTRALNQFQGDVLVFLPGVAEIKRCRRLLQARLDSHIELHDLHSGVGNEAQARATRPASKDVRRVILSTSLAETSVTIEGVSIVVDSGLERRAAIDSATGAQRLETVSASQASATQRAGRAGRTTSGICVRLWSETGHTRRAAHWQPEIYRADLAPLIVELALWGTSRVEDLTWVDPPPAASIARAKDLLTRLGLLSGGQLTQNGRAAAALPVHPRLGRMLIWAKQNGHTTQACQIAAMLDDATPANRSTDIEALLQLSPNHTQKRRLQQLERALGAEGSAHTAVSAAVLLAQAFPDWIAQRRAGAEASYRLACGAGATLALDDRLAHEPWLVVAELGGSQQPLRIFKAAALNIEELEVHAPELFSTVRHIDWDHKQQRIIAEQRSMIGELTISAQTLQELSAEERVGSLLIGLRKAGPDALPWDTATREWQARMARMAELETRNGNPDWPRVDDGALMDTLESWLAPWLHNTRSLKALQQVPLMDALEAILDYPQQQQLNDCFPKKYTVPSGSRIALRYTSAGPPVLSVRLQEMLGCTTNPTIARGQIPLKIELLSPAHRPVQVTTDLASFWVNSYADVKKDMAGRYPKHYWPDDPENAQPSSDTRRPRKDR